MHRFLSGRQGRDVSMCGFQFFQHRPKLEGDRESHDNCFHFHIIMGEQIVEGLKRAMTKSNQWVGTFFFVAVSCSNRE